MFNLDVLILSKIIGLITGIKTSFTGVTGLVNLMYFAIVGGMGSTAINEFVKIKRGDYKHDVPQTKRQGYTKLHRR